MKKTFQNIFVISKLCIVLVAVVGVGSVGADSISTDGQLNIENNIGSSHPVASVIHYDAPGVSEGFDSSWETSWLSPPSGNSSLYSDIGTNKLKEDFRLPSSTSDFVIKFVYNGTLGSSASDVLLFNLPWPETEFGSKPILFQSNLLPYGPVVDIRKAIAQNSGIVPLIDLPAGTYTTSTPYGEGILTIGTRKLADLSDNGDIDLEDFALLSLDWQNPVQGQYIGDITGASGIPDGYVDMYDLLEFVSGWLE